MSSLAFRILLAVMAVAVAGLTHAASSASGTFTYKETKLEVKNAYAFHTREKGSIGSVYVFLTDKPVDAAAVAADADPEMGMMKNAKGADYVRVCVTAEGRDCGLFNSSTGFNVGGEGEFKLTTNTATRIEGTFGMSKPGDFFGKPYQFNLKWAADISP